MSEKSVEAAVLSIDVGVQALVSITECSVQFSPVLVDDQVSVTPHMNKVSVDARPTFSDAGVLAIPNLLESPLEPIMRLGGPLVC